MSGDIIELLGMLIILAFFISGVQWLLVRYTHWSVALIATGIISLLISILYVSLEHATPNGGGNGPDAFEFITPAFVIFGSLLCGLALVCYFTQNRLPKKAFILPLSFIFVFTIARFIYQYVDSVTLYSEIFSRSEIAVLDKTNSIPIVQEINFYGESLVKTIYSNSNEKQDPIIPRFANKIIFRCYSSKTDRMFEQDFPFDYSLCKEKEGERLGYCFWLREKIISPMKIVFQPHNKVDLYINNHLVKQYQLSDSESTQAFIDDFENLELKRAITSNN